MLFWAAKRYKPGSQSERENPEQTKFCLALPLPWGWWLSAERLLEENGNGWAEMKHGVCFAGNFHIKRD